ncbi:hypothetical protein BTK96_004240 [Burkholderia pyrrocinia]|uniref:hypothetical protein n=1 Tax=Burkholderia sp. IT-111MI5 TaxID=3026439 RepID=UPI002A2BF88A|nr:hypothetical protein [Burkholderia pyrrocinia]EKS9895921.1 hypothetical protein [Burkholderia pyrrocinia]EKS9908970.1 hypothetical protein [Burkholderia pyrrocinia]
MKSISKLKVAVGEVVLLALIAVVGAKVVMSPTDSYLADRKKAAEAVNAARMEDRADLDKKYTAELNAKLVKLVGTVKEKSFPGRRGVTFRVLSRMTG